MRSLPALLLVLAPAAAAQTTWVIEASATPPGSGTFTSPYASIQFAIDQFATVPGDRLLVRPGLYVENVDFGTKRLVLESEGGPLATEIRAAGPGHVVALSPSLPGAGTEHRVSGFTITGSIGPTDAGIAIPPMANVAVRRCIVRDNAGIGIFNDYDLQIETTTIVGNGLGFQNTGLGIFQMTHSIIFGNAVESDIRPTFGSIINDSILPPCSVCGGSTSYEDPLFWDRDARDLHLRTGSPAIQAGTDMGALEYDPDYAPSPENVCVSLPNSAGPGATMGSSGSPSVSANDFTLTVTGAPPGVFGLFYYGGATVQIAFGDGFRCVGAGDSGTFRLSPSQTVDASGTALRLLDSNAVLPGSSWTCQFWYRDPVGPGGTGFNLSDGLRAHFAR